MTKPRVAVFDFAGCEGDELQIANLEEDLLALIGHVDVVSFREVMKEHSDEYDIALVEGSCTRPMDEERLKKIRQNAKIVIAIGACACIGGVNCIRNSMPLEDALKVVYGENTDGKYLASYEARPIDAVIKVDYYVHGCPIDKNELLSVLKSLLMGAKPSIPNYPVCVECKKNGNVCAFERGEYCMGPITRAGCNSCCVNEGTWCWGCRGPVNNPNTDAHKEVLEKYGLSLEEMMNRFSIYYNYKLKDKLQTMKKTEEQQASKDVKPENAESTHKEGEQ